MSEEPEAQEPSTCEGGEDQVITSIDNLPLKYDTQVAHIQQQANWDCGIACVLMVLPKAEKNILLSNLQRIVQDEGFGTSTWTIDLCYLLRRYGMRHLYCTTTMGINPNYTRESFYEKALTKDSERVMNKFRRAQAEGVNVEESTVELPHILAHLAAGNKGGPVIVLTDGQRLYCTTCRFNRINMEIYQCFPCAHSYQGHYIVVCGYDLDRRMINYHNPTLKDRVCSMPFDTFEEARSTFGTDEDIIFVYHSS